MNLKFDMQPRSLFLTLTRLAVSFVVVGLITGLGGVFFVGCDQSAETSIRKLGTGMQGSVVQEQKLTAADSGPDEKNNAAAEKLSSEISAVKQDDQTPVDSEKSLQGKPHQDSQAGGIELTEIEKQIQEIGEQEVEIQEREIGTSEQTIEIPKTWTRLGKHEIWIDLKSKEVIVGGTICMQRGQLEVFVCPAHTKEHESVIAANAKSSEVHAALLAIGTDPGTPCQWDPVYKPATGPVIDVQVRWFDEEQQKLITRPGPSMVRDSETKKQLSHQWVFGGSVTWTDPETGETVYYGDGGEMICVSNFSSATMDLNVESSQSNAGLMYEAFTENIPPVGTKVYVVMKPGGHVGPEKEADKPKSAEPKPLEK